MSAHLPKTFSRKSIAYALRHYNAFVVLLRIFLSFSIFPLFYNCGNTGMLLDSDTLSKKREKKRTPTMDENECKSEVARLMRQITLEYEAAANGLNGLASGMAQHAYITAKMQRMGACHNELITLVGKQEAAIALATALEQAKDDRSGDSAVGHGEMEEPGPARGCPGMLGA
jgi:hypothetical protein